MAAVLHERAAGRRRAAQGTLARSAGSSTATTPSVDRTVMTVQPADKQREQVFQAREMEG